MASESQPIVFETLFNNGASEGMTNQCMFLSIADCLGIVNNISSPSVRVLRELVRFPGGTDEMFDFDINGHRDSLCNLCKLFNIGIHFFTMRRNDYERQNDIDMIGCWITEPETSINIDRVGSQRQFAIVSYGSHFELIVSKTSVTQKITVPSDLEARKSSHGFSLKSQQSNSSSGSNSCWASSIGLQQYQEQRQLGQQRLEQQRLEQQRLEQQRLEQQRLEQQRLEQQRLEQQRLEQQRLEQQRQLYESQLKIAKDESLEQERHRIQETLAKYNHVVASSVDKSSDYKNPLIAALCEKLLRELRKIDDELS
jgi:hypothetical protein